MCVRERAEEEGPPAALDGQLCRSPSPTPPPARLLLPYLLEAQSLEKRWGGEMQLLGREASGCKRASRGRVDSRLWRPAQTGYGAEGRGRLLLVVHAWSVGGARKGLDDEQLGFSPPFPGVCVCGGECVCVCARLSLPQDAPRASSVLQ